MEELREEENQDVKISFDFTKQEYLDICEECLFNDLEREILLMKITGHSIVEMSLKLNVSTSKISKIIRKIKNKIIRVV